MNTIDINCDLGEGYGKYTIGSDKEIFPYITSSNIACGFHAGDPVHMQQTIALALQHQVQIGAHPGFPDLSGFGRRKMDLPGDQLKAIIKYQLAAITGMAESMGARVTYVKPHGALYNMAAGDENISKILIAAVREMDPNLKLMGLAGSLIQQICQSEQMPFIAEGFADRGYLPDGSLQPRSSGEAVLIDPEKAAQQALEMVLRKQITCHNGKIVPLQVQSICVHGDNPAVVNILKAIDKVFNQAGVIKEHF